MCLSARAISVGNVTTDGPPLHQVALNPAQQDVVDQLGASPDQRPTFSVTLRQELRAELEHAVDHALADLPAAERPLYVSKHRLSQLDGCEVRAQAEEQAPFAWSVATARGAVAHKAIELSVHWRRESIPLDLVDESLARLEQGDDSFARWLQGLDEAGRAELRGDAGERVTKFLESWPPLKATWRPVTESRLRIELARSDVVLAGKVDLALGRAEGSTAGKVIVDLKTGGTRPAHLQDLRFYALLETLRIGVPPRRVASYYLDQGRFVPEDVNVDALLSALARVSDGVTRIVQLIVDPASARYRAGPACHWCPVLAECSTGRQWLAARIDDGGIDDAEPYEPDEE